MNTETGQLLSLDEIEKLPLDQRSKYIKVERDLTQLEEAMKQIKIYDPCGCGSGKKFKFCCYKNK